MSKLAILLLGLSLLAQGCALAEQANVRAVVNDTSNWYDQSTRTIHIAPNQSQRVYLHETCHAWQGRNLPADDIALAGWKRTPEGADFPGSLEQAADVCASHYLGVEPTGPYITTVDPYWTTWAETWLP